MERFTIKNWILKRVSDGSTYRTEVPGSVLYTLQNGTMVIPRLELFNDMGHIESFIIEKLHFEK